VDSRSRARARAQVSEAAKAEPPRRPRTLSLAGVIQAVEAAGVLGAAVLAGVDAGSGRSYHVNSGIALTIIGVATAAALAWVAAGVAQARAWSRTPALLTQLFVGIVSIYLVQATRYEWGVPGLVLAVAGFVTLLAPPSTRVLARSPLAPPADRKE
jgi:predicted Co/Zn/Cd cation transporter (cation efflux family)